jgi:hypothetical protein
MASHHKRDSDESEKIETWVPRSSFHSNSCLSVIWQELKIVRHEVRIKADSEEIYVDLEEALKSWDLRNQGKQNRPKRLPSWWPGRPRRDLYWEDQTNCHQAGSV